MYAYQLKTPEQLAAEDAEFNRRMKADPWTEAQEMLEDRFDDPDRNPYYCETHGLWY
ncbi:MAG: hypothetical protein HDR03_14880 [Lachnospiraceae bacterium]|nr:hypothetical protein [Lachnospiraceae bacterium]